MVNLNIFKTRKAGIDQVDTIEAFNIWNLLRHRYISIESYQMLRNFVHDRDLYLLISAHMHDFQKQAQILEGVCKKFKLKAPNRPPKDIKIPVQLEEITDRHIYRGIYSDILAELYALDRAMRTTTTNDSLRNQIISFFFDHMESFEDLYKYGKLKGFTDVEPAYKTQKPVQREPISASEATHLWDHLNARYDHIRLTMFYQQFIHDKDFKMVLSQGLSTLEQQATMLEDLCMQYAVPLPNRPPAVQEVSIDPESLEDEFIFRTIFTGIQTALELHTRAVIETIRNDKLRKIFFNLLKDEITLYDTILKYGKMKGWTKIVPMYISTG